jgi:hypothetical protein
VTVKITLFLQLATNVDFPANPARRIGGWTESWYFAGVDTNAAIVATNEQIAGAPGLCRARSATLPQSASIVGQRFQLVAPNVGPSQSLNKFFPGQFGQQNDIPQMALLCRVPALGAANIRRLVLRGIPDASVVEGEYSPSIGFTQALNALFICLGNFQFRGRDLTQPTLKMIMADASGNVSTEVPATYNVNDMVRVLKASTSKNSLVGGRFQVTTTGPLTTNFKLLNWNLGSTTGGSVRKDGIVFVNVDAQNISTGRIIVKKVGRPFTQYRGRRSARKH